MFHVSVKTETGHWKSGSSKNKTDMRVPLGGYALDQHNTHKSLDKKVKFVPVLSTKRQLIHVITIDNLEAFKEGNIASLDPESEDYGR